MGSAIGAFVPVKTLPDAKTRGYEAADVMLRPNLYHFRPTDLDRASTDAMFEIGYNEAKENMPKIKALLQPKKRT